MTLLGKKQMIISQPNNMLLKNTLFENALLKNMRTHFHVFAVLKLVKRKQTKVVDWRFIDTAVDNFPQVIQIESFVRYSIYSQLRWWRQLLRRLVRSCVFSRQIAS